MQEFTQVYKQNTKDITNFVTQTILNLGNIKNLSDDNYKKLFEVFPSLELVYTCESNSFLQSSSNYYRNKVDNTSLGKDRSYLKEKIKFTNEKLSISDPYLSSATGNTCITVAKQENDFIYFLDLDISILLERLGLIEMNVAFNIITKSFYLVNPEKPNKRLYLRHLTP